MRSQKCDRHAVPFLGPCFGSFFEICCIKVAEAQRFGFNEALGLMAAGRATVFPQVPLTCVFPSIRHRSGEVTRKAGAKENTNLGDRSLDSRCAAGGAMAAAVCTSKNRATSSLSSRLAPV